MGKQMAEFLGDKTSDSSECELLCTKLLCAYQGMEPWTKRPGLSQVCTTKHIRRDYRNLIQGFFKESTNFLKLFLIRKTAEDPSYYSLEERKERGDMTEVQDTGGQ